MIMKKNPQQVEMIMTYSSISSTEHQLNIHSKSFRNCLLITKNYENNLLRNFSAIRYL